MKHSIVPLFLAGLVLLLVVAVPVSADLLTVTGISPSVGYTGETVTVTITGTNFTSSDGDVTLDMSGENNIDASRISSWSDTKIVCKFKIPSDTESGDWTLIVTRDDDEETEADEEFTIADPFELTSISPTEGQMENESVDFTLKGSGLSDIEEVYLYNNDYDNNITADIDEADSDKITGTFDLSDTDEDKYKVCVEDSYGTVKCALSFQITTDEVGSITVSSSPSGASIYVDNEYIGLTPGTEGNLVEGAHKVAVKKTGYLDWADVVLVSEGDETEVNANLVAVTTVPTPVPTTEPIEERTTRDTPRDTPTAPSTPVPTTQKSPVGIMSVIGIISLAFMALRKH